MPSSPLRVGLLQISEQVGSRYYFPYSADCLQAYAQQHARRQDLSFAPIVYQRISPYEGVKALGDVQIAAFSLYCWNERRSMALARALRQVSPKVLIVCGGPQVPDACEAYLREHPYIDICVHGPGEATFTALIDLWPEPDWDQLKGVSWIDRDGTFQHRPQAPRDLDLSAYPSPYLSGVFDPLLQSARHEWRGVWETNRGCPFSCSFCDWGSAIASKVARFPFERVAAEADWFGRHGIQSIFVNDANFGILPRDVELTRMMVERAQYWGAPGSLTTQSAKNSPERVVEINQLLAEAGLQTLAAISLQSISAPALTAIKRTNLSLQAFSDIQQACHRHGIRTYTDMILGLPEENYSGFVTGVDAIIDNGQHHFIQFFDAGVLPNAELARPDYRARYGLETVEIPFPSHPLLPDGIVETQEIVIATAAMPRADNLRAHVFAWSTLFWHHTHKLLQPALLMLRQTSGRPYSFWIEQLMNAPAARYPHLGENTEFFRRTAQAVHQGSIESQLQSRVMRPRPGVMLSPELSLQIKWVLEDQIEILYQEAFDWLRQVIRQENLEIDDRLLNEAFQISLAQFLQLFKVDGLDLPQLERRFALKLSYDLPAFVRSILAGEPAPLEARPLTVWTNELPRQLSCHNN